MSQWVTERSGTSLVVWWPAGSWWRFDGRPLCRCRPALDDAQGGPEHLLHPPPTVPKKKKNLLWKWGTRKCRLLRAQKANRFLKGTWLGLKHRHFVCRRNHLFALAGKRGSTFYPCSVFEQNAGYFWVGLGWGGEVGGGLQLVQFADGQRPEICICVTITTLMLLALIITTKFSERITRWIFEQQNLHVMRIKYENAMQLNVKSDIKKPVLLRIPSIVLQGSNFYSVLWPW